MEAGEYWYRPPPFSFDPDKVIIILIILGHFDPDKVLRMHAHHVKVIRYLFVGESGHGIVIEVLHLVAINSKILTSSVATTHVLVALLPNVFCFQYHVQTKQYGKAVPTE